MTAKLGIVVQHPDGHSSVVPVTQMPDGSHSAKVKAGCTVVAVEADIKGDVIADLYALQRRMKLGPDTALIGRAISEIHLLQLHKAMSVGLAEALLVAREKKI